MSLITMPHAAHRRSPAARFFEHLRAAAVREGVALRAELREVGRVASYVRHHVAPHMMRVICRDTAALVAIVLFGTGFPLGVYALIGAL